MGRQTEPMKRVPIGNKVRALRGVRVGGLERSKSRHRSKYSSSLIFQCLGINEIKILKKESIYKASKNLKDCINLFSITTR